MVSLKCREILCLIYSSVLFILGAFLIGFSTVIAYKIFYYFKFMPSNTIGPIIILFLLGFIYLLLTWLGVKGPTRQHDFHIVMFMVITVTLMVTEIIVVTWSTILVFQISNESNNLMNSSFDALLKNDLDKNDWNKIQKKLKCCGLNGVQDYEGKLSIPISCCDQESLKPSTCPKIFEQGCLKPFIKNSKTLLLETVSVSSCTACFQVLGLYAFYTFYRALKEERKKRSTLQRTTLQRQTTSPATAPDVTTQN